MNEAVIDLFISILIRKHKPLRHRIGIHENSYCLVRSHPKGDDVLMAKTITDPIQFKEEVENIAKIFNATIIEETTTKHQHHEQQQQNT
jgi:hypothetical protein